MLLTMMRTLVDNIMGASSSRLAPAAPALGKLTSMRELGLVNVESEIVCIGMCVRGNGVQVQMQKKYFFHNYCL